MTEAFKEKIKNYPHPLFYNTDGSSVAYKLAIRHLSAASFVGLATKASGYLYPESELHIVDLENETIEVVTKEVKLIPLQGLK